MNPDDRRPLAYLGATVLLWGTSFAVTKSAYASFPPMTVIWLRMVIAFLAALPFLRRLPRPDYRRGDWKYLTVATLFLPCLYFALEGYAIQFTSSGQAGVVAAVMPLIVGLAAWVFLRERPTWQRVAAILASMLGVAMLSLGGLQQAAAPNPGLGNLLELGAMVAAAGATITIKHLSTRYDAWLLTVLQMGVGSVFFAPLALAGATPDWGTVPALAWAAVAYLGIGCGLAAFGLYNSALKLIPATRAALAINLIPAVALITGWLALGETMSLHQIAACVLIIGAVGFAQLSPGVGAEAKAPVPQSEAA